jgi:hypothetical protein
VWRFTVTDDPGPNIPHDPIPPTGSTPENNPALLRDLNFQLQWSCEHPKGFSLKYDVYFGETTNPEKVASNLTVPYYPAPLTSYKELTKYYWKIVAKDN